MGSKRYSFKNDYSEGAHPNIIQALSRTNLEQQDGYGEDAYCMQAKTLILKKLGTTESEVHFISGGTQANLVVISSILKPYESVIAVDTGHINVHETGAIEATGHKINICKSDDGKLTPKMIEDVVNEHTDEHMVKPKLVYISNSTELGTVYNKQELTELQTVCQVHDLYLFMDGARLGSALCAAGNDLKLADLAHLVDVFYIGGTKNGALIGEAIVINNKALQTNFRYYLKQRGALLAKGRVMGLQFLELFKDDLFFNLARHANAMATHLSEAIMQCGFTFLAPPTSNIQFPILTNDIIEKLSKKYLFYITNVIDAEHSAIRLVTSWATPPEVVAEFIADLKCFK